MNNSIIFLFKISLTIKKQSFSEISLNQNIFATKINILDIYN